jgi:putative glutamine amidotransferase
MKKPLIGICTDRSTVHGRYMRLELSESYTRAILQAGGIPILIPEGVAVADLPSLRVRLDGLLLPGGGDIEPVRYGAHPHPKVNEMDAERDELEFALVHLAVATSWPFLGICRGIQVINVTLGGSLFSDLADQVPGAMRHDWYPSFPRDRLAHHVSVAPESRLAGILGSDFIETNSLHHQGLERLAPGLLAAGHAPDGLVEAVELSGHPFGMGVQWHPEWLVHLPMAEHARKLLIAFVNAAGKDGNDGR